MDRTGQCLCGAVQFVAHDVSAKGEACHCHMCRRWSGGSWIGTSVKSIEWTSEDALQMVTSSDWAERGFCNRCGSSLFYRITAEGPHKGLTSISLGCLKDSSGITLNREYFIDRKPEAYSLEGDHERLTEAEAMAMFDG